MSVRTEIDRIIGAVEAAHTAIVEKGGTTVRPYLVGNLADAINTIPVSADPKLQTKTVSPATSTQTVKPDSGYDGLSQVTVNAMPTATQATPSISVSSGGLITASATQSAGYVAAGTKSATKQLTVQAAQTITPGTSNKTIASGRYLTGTQTIKGDANLKAANIAQGVSIFGITGTHSGGGVEVETCTVSFNVINYSSDNLCYLYYTKPDLSVGYTAHQDIEGSLATPTSITVLKNSIAVVVCEDTEIDMMDLYSTGGIDQVREAYGRTLLFIIRGDGIIGGSVS